MDIDRTGTYDPSLTGSADDGIYGIPGTLDDASLVYIPVPWEVTTSYGKGTAMGPETIRKASPQLDLYLRGLPNHFEKGFYLLPPEPEIVELNSLCGPLAAAIQNHLEQHGSLDGNAELMQALEDVNRASKRVNELIYDRCRALDTDGKLLALIGGDHSSPLGQIHYLCDRYNGNLGLLHIDAHHDLRDRYQGFTGSHASIMRNVIALNSAPSRLVQVGIRDFSKEECAYAEQHPAIDVFYDDDMKERLYEGEPFAAIADSIIERLPEKVYISFDIDGLKPDLCPHTGTPVSGGLEFEQARFLLKRLVQSGRRIVGFDLCEVAPNPHAPEDEWDGNVGARLLFLLSSWMMESQPNA